MHTFRLAVCCMFLLMLSVPGWAAPEFDIQLNELKKPSLPAVSKKAVSPPSGKTKSKWRSRKYRAKKRGASALTAPQEQSPAGRVIVGKPLPVEEITIHPGLPCKLAGRVADTLAAEADNIPSLLQGLRLAPVAVAQHEGATVIITCGLASAERYTLERLLETRNVQLLNINGRESAEQVIEGIINSLGYSYRLEHGEKGTNYLVLLESGKDTMLKLVISPDP